MLIRCIVQLLECIEPNIQVCWQAGRIVILQGGVAQREAAILIIRKACYLLSTCVLDWFRETDGTLLLPRTLGRLIVVFDPPKRFAGCMLKAARFMTVGFLCGAWTEI